MSDFKFFRRQDEEWVEGDYSFDLLLSTEVELYFKLSPLREMRAIHIKVETELPFSLAILDNLDGVYAFTTEDVYIIDYLNKTDKYLILKLKPTKTGNYKGSFAFDYLVK